MTQKISTCLPESALPGFSRLLVEVEFGVLSRQCANYGICRIEIARGPGRSENSRCGACCGRALASAPGEGELQLAFFRSSLRKDALRRHFSEEYFLVEEAVALPGLLCEGLKAPAAAIDCGRYPILKTPYFLIVLFNNLIKP